MPIALERKLKKEASAKGLKGDRKDAYVYGTLRKTGWVPNRAAKNHEKKVKMVDYENHVSTCR